MFSVNKLVIGDPGTPFLKDFTGELKEIARLTTALAEAETKDKPFVISLDAPWGAGKTTFIDMWGQCLLNDQKIAIKFDAWEADHRNDAQLALIAALITQLQSSNELIQTLKDIGSLILLVGADMAMRTVPGLKQLKPYLKKVPNIGKSELKKRIESLEEKDCLLSLFKEQLKKIAKGKTVFLFIDELDRCKPTFALSILEIIKHFFDIDGVCCILSVNCSMFKKHIKSVYGYEDYETDDYLERFFDINMRLPEPKRDVFVEKELSSINISFKNREDFFATIKKCSQLSNMSLRVIKKYIQSIKLFLQFNDLSYQKIPEAYFPSIAYLLAKKKVNSPSLSQELSRVFDDNLELKWLDDFFNSGVSEEELNAVFGKLFKEINGLDKKSSRRSEENHRLEILNTVINIVNSIYDGVEDVLKSYANSTIRTPIKKLKNYHNFLGDTEQIINCLKIIGDPEINTALEEDEILETV